MTGPKFPALDVALEFLDRGNDDRYVWVSPGALIHLLDAMFAVERAPKEGVDELIRLALVLETQWSSPDAAMELRAALASDARVMKLLDVEEQQRTKKKAASRWSGTNERRHAPMFGAERPMGTISAVSLMRPLRSP